MNFLFLRGRWPSDRKDPMEIVYDSIDKETCMWSELTFWLTGDRKGDSGTVLYWDCPKPMVKRYKSNFTVRFVKDISDYKEKADIVFYRGGFPELAKARKQWPLAVSLYYGANHWKEPPKDRLYSIILVDSEKQKKYVESWRPLANVHTFFKPAATIFRPRKVEKKYDCCFVAIHPRNRRKNVQWVYQTIPKGLSVLQLGNSPKYAVPKNVTVKHVSREKMPKAMSKCRVGIVPYRSDDSGPRVIPEFLSCGVPVVALSRTHYNRKAYSIVPAVAEGEFWNTVIGQVNRPSHTQQQIVNFYDTNLRMELAAQHIKELIESLWAE